jgi:hypothetical protein
VQINAGISICPGAIPGPGHRLRICNTGYRHFWSDGQAGIFGTGGDCGIRAGAD